jgi:endo-1,4-beta-D-glucanase Y
MPFTFKGKLTGFRIKLSGSVPSTARVHFVSNLTDSATPFIPAKLGESAVYSIADAQVPADWTVPNAGQRVSGDVLYSIQIMVPGAETAGPIDLCIEAFEPVTDAVAMPSGTSGAYVNRDGLISATGNTLGLQGLVYAFGDGKSTTQVGNPYKDGKYCVSGQFSGAAADWGAGIAFDLNKAAGSTARLPYAFKGKVGGFRIALSGQTPGPARIQFNINEPQSGNQPFLVAQVGSTMDYRISWATVPTSWTVSDAGLRVGDAIYTLQVYLEGSVAGPFNVCVDDFVPLPDANLGQPAVAASAPYKGFRSIDPKRLKAEYDTWKARHYTECTDGSACVPRDEGDCISEGIGYGMLLTVAFDDQPAFDKLWKFYSNHKGSTGLMDWQAARCGGTQQAGWATDGDLDVAMALIQASCKWGMTYDQNARAVIANIKNSSIETCSNGHRLLKPGSFGGCNGTERQVDPSYLATGYFKVFASLTGDAAWTSLVDDSYSLLSAAQAKMNGLVPDWSDPSGNPPSGDRGKYGPDASRTPWRIAADYAWYGEARAVTFLDKVAAYVEAQGGIDKALAPASNYRGGLAMSGIHKDAATAQRYTDAWLTTSVDDGTYYPGTLRPLYLLLLANQFPNACK